MSRTPSTPSLPGALGPPRGSPPGPLRRLSTGWDELDERLQGGWPEGELVELGGRGRTSLALQGVRRAQAEGLPCAWVDGGGSFCPATAGVDLSRLTLVSPPREREALYAADVLLRSRAYALVVLDVPGPRGSLAGWFRLARLARQARCVLFVLQGSARPRTGSAALLLLGVRLVGRDDGLVPGELPPPLLEVSVLRHRGHASGGSVLLEQAPPGRG